MSLYLSSKNRKAERMLQNGSQKSILHLDGIETPLLHGHFDMSASHLGNTPLNIVKLRDGIRKRLPELLDTVCAPVRLVLLPYITATNRSNRPQVRGKKGLILDPQLTGPLSLIAEIPLLKVNHCKLYNHTFGGLSGSLVKISGPWS